MHRRALVFLTQQLAPADLSAPDQFVISKVERLGPAPLDLAILFDVSGSRREVFDR